MYVFPDILHCQRQRSRWWRKWKLLLVLLEALQIITNSMPEGIYHFEQNTQQSVLRLGVILKNLINSLKQFSH